MSKPEYATENTWAPVCPTCGYEERDAWEFDFGPGIEGDAVYSCGSCEAEVEVFRHVTVDYSTKIKEAT